MDRGQMIEEASKAMYAATVEGSTYADLARAAFAVFENAYSHGAPVGIDAEETAERRPVGFAGRAWAQDTTLYIEPTSDVREIRLQPAWAGLSSERLLKKLRLARRRFSNRTTRKKD